MQEIDIIIEPSGDVVIEGKNIQGTDCKALTKEIEAALGTVSATKLKPEYHRGQAVPRKAGA